jgi:hypothetical protein
MTVAPLLTVAAAAAARGQKNARPAHHDDRPRHAFEQRHAVWRKLDLGIDHVLSTADTSDAGRSGAAAGSTAGGRDLTRTVCRQRREAPIFRSDVPSLWR